MINLLKKIEFSFFSQKSIWGVSKPSQGVTGKITKGLKTAPSLWKEYEKTSKTSYFPSRIHILILIFSFYSLKQTCEIHNLKKKRMKKKNLKAEPNLLNVNVFSEKDPV